MVSQFVLDYMHLVCLGVVRKLILMWMNGSLTCRLGSAAISSISDALIKMTQYVPVEFSRKPRSLVEVKRWKATEFRCFLLYTGPVILASKLSETMYKFFLLLSTGM